MQASQAIFGVVTSLQALEHELLLFVAFWFVVGALDEFAVDVCWIALRVTGKARDGSIPQVHAAAALSGRAAILIAAWREAEVIGHTVRHALSAWPQQGFTLYVGCYPNDPGTIAEVVAAAAGDPRLRLVINGRPGPTTKADCLNTVYAALCCDEGRNCWRFRSVVLHDAEDMVHPAELAVIDEALDRADFVQLPVYPELMIASPWVSAHYADEFAESHGKGMVVRDALGAAIPAAGVGCGFSRDIIERIARRQDRADGPFAAECLTEDYELGLLIRREGGRSRFLRVRDASGVLVATRAYFPARLSDSVRQKSRWVHGIAFQGWERLGWTRGLVDIWMSLRDRRGPLTSIVLACGYVILGIELVRQLVVWSRLVGPIGAMAHSALLQALLGICFASFLWRSAWRFHFTARDYGIVEGLGAIPRVIVANVIAICAGTRALIGYTRTLQGKAVQWEKTSHEGHPTLHEAAFNMGMAA